MPGKEAPQLLLVEDNALEADFLKQELAEQGYAVTWVEDGESALAALQENHPALVLLDIRLPRMDGIEVVRRIKAGRQSRFIPVIMVTALTEVEERVRGLDAGADDYITKPFQSFELLARIRSMLRLRRTYEELASTEAKLKKTREENRWLRQEIQGKYAFEQIVGRSPAIRDTFYLMEKAIESPVTVLILGETGTGKELVARSIHYNGARKGKPFVVQNCGALPESLLESELFGHKKGAFTGAVADKKGLFEVAHGGTIFLDEVGDTPPSLQVRLLRVLQEGEIRRLGEVHPQRVDVRVIAATNRDLQEEIKAGKFREDLYYRIQTFPIPLPPLRQRTGDVPLLVDHFLKKYNPRLEKQCLCRGDALSLLEQYPFPGNVRELENEIVRAMTLAGPTEEIEPRHLSEAVRKAGAGPTPAKNGCLQDQTGQLEKAMIVQALQENRGNRTRAAQKLGLSRRGLLNKIKRYDLE
ncbi:MAG: sigma-54-dependent Fis family transcriptional regulator [Deltaproteobacteria bacterium]|nr:sigma-54-dependent Fis family transcriptional regulator [Deltaproteobacteria bacterium]